MKRESNESEPMGNAPLSLLSNRYKVLSVLGSGGFGQTFLAEDTQMPSKRRCVLKQLKPVHEKPELYQMVQDRFSIEAATLETLGEGHEQIPCLYAHFSEADQFYLVQEWIEGLTLTQKVQRAGPQSERMVKMVVAELLPVIAYIHSKKIVHRDVKPDNVILRRKDGKPVLIDFGAVKEIMKTMAKGVDQSAYSMVVGTPGYMPSEQLLGRPMFVSDVYSLGMTAIYLLTGKMPSEFASDPSTGAISWREHAPTVSIEFANFLDCATHMDAQNRFAGAQAMQVALNGLIMSQMNIKAPAYETSFGGKRLEPPQVSPTVISTPPIGSKTTVDTLLAAPASVPQMTMQTSKPARESLISKLSFIPIVLCVVGVFGLWYLRSHSKGDSTLSTVQQAESLNPQAESETALITPSENKIEDRSGNNTKPLFQREKTREENINDIADRLFAERHPELGGRKLNQSETAYINEWNKLRACDAVVDFTYHERHPELAGRKILKGDSRAQQEWESIAKTVSGCNNDASSNSEPSTGAVQKPNKTRDQKIDDIADALFHTRHPELKGRDIQDSEAAYRAEWKQIRSCDAVVDFIYYGKHPDRGSRKISASETEAQQEWISIKNTVPGCQ